MTMFATRKKSLVEGDVQTRRWDRKILKIGYASITGALEEKKEAS